MPIDLVELDLTHCIQDVTKLVTVNIDLLLLGHVK